MGEVADKTLRYNEIYFSPEQQNLIIDLYHEGNSTVVIGKMFGVSHKKIARILESRNISRTGVGKRLYSLDENYFDNIDTPNKAYVLGFLCADGSNSMSKGTVQMSLQESDKDILDQIRGEIKSSKPLEYIDYSNKHDFGYCYQNQYRLCVHSKKMCEALSACGMVPNKSNVLSYPSCIQQQFHSHFIRGYFDGDGSISRYKSNYNVTITSTRSFCDHVSVILNEVININCGIYDASNHNGVTSVLTASGKNQVERFMEYIYQDATLYLHRKRKRYLEYYNLSN